MQVEEKRKILYVDDEDSNLRVFKNLYRRDFNIVTASSAKESLGLFDDRAFDLVISDQRMPQTSGLELLAKIKERNPLVPTILLTGYTDHDILKKAFNDVGVHRYINKPFDPESLLIVMELAIEGYHLSLRNNSIQANLKASESKFRGIFNSMADVFIRVDNDRRIQVVSPSIEGLSGYIQEELVGQDVNMLYVNPEERHVLAKDLKSNGFSSRFEALLLTKDGKHKYVSSNSKWYFDDENNSLGIESIVRDISEKKKMEQELQEQGHFLNEVQRMANLGSWQWDYSDDNIICSETLFRIYGIDAKDNVALTFDNYLSYFHHKDKKRVRSILVDAFRNKDHFAFDATIVRADGSEREITSWGNCIKNNQGTIQKVTVACMDLTETRKREKALAESEEKFRLLSEQSPIRIFKVNRKLKVEYANKLAISQLDNKENELPTIHDFFHEEVHNTIIKYIRKVFESNEIQSTDFEQREEGEEKWFSIDFTPLKDEIDTTNSVLMLVHDVTAKKKVESMLRDMNQQLETQVKIRTKALEEAKNDLELAYVQEKELSKLKSQFVSTASHQFRTPLTVIQSNIGLLEMQIGNAEPEFQQKFDKVYQRIQSEVKRMTDLMDNVLILGKKESGVIQPSLQMVDVLILTKAIVGKYNQIQEDGRSIEVTYSGDPSMYHLDPELFENAFSNLISNAFKYSHAKPSPKVHLIFKKNKLKLTVQDFGVGIPEADIDNIFEPFYRATNVKDIKGTGLGTSIVKAYLELMDASIEIKSKINEGTKFIIKIKK